MKNIKGKQKSGRTFLKRVKKNEEKNEVINYKNLVQEFTRMERDVATLDFEMIDNVFVYIKK